MKSMKENREPEEIKEKEDPGKENEPEDKEEKKKALRVYLVLPVIVCALVSAAEIYILQQSITGLVRNLIVMGIISFAAVYTCNRWINTRIAVLITGLAVVASLQAFLPDFILPIAAFAVVIAIRSESPFLGLSCLIIFAAMPFMAVERPFEYFLFYTVTGLAAIMLIYSRRKTGKYADANAIFVLVYILLYTGLIIMKRMTITPGLIIAPAVALILNVVIMEIAGYTHYTNVVKPEEDIYLNVVDPEYPLLIRLKNNNKREFKRAIHTAHYTELYAHRFGYDPVLMKGLGFYHRIGVLREDSASLAERTVGIVTEEGFPEDIVKALKEYGEAIPGEKISAEVSITIIVDTVIDNLMKEFASDRKDPDLNKFVDKTILKLFSGKDSLLKRSAIPYNDLEEIRKHLKGEKIYYDFLR
ncbi:MAG: hypothetical protein K6G42_00690 [Lachnospiraceae bacterium]|nr:hypothetical protein [Lachnospiraceae bacterium]